jgi:preprotein translocase subunit SecG
MTLAFVWPAWLVGIVAVAFLVICVVMVLTVLIQKPQGGGLAGAFGSGAGSGQTAFGTKTGDALTIFTIIVFCVYILFAVLLNWGAKAQKLGPSDPAITAPADEVPADGGTTPPAGETPPTPTGDAPATTPADSNGVPAPETAPATEPTTPPTTTPTPTPEPVQPANPG